MPNWCYTNLNIHADKESIDLLDQKLDEAMNRTSDPSTTTDFGSRWLGNLLIASGYSEDDLNKEGVPCCRGEVEYYERTGSFGYVINITSAWSPQLGALVKFLEHLGIDADITYTAEELGMCLYVTNNPIEIDTFIVCDEENYSTEYAYTEEMVKDLLIEKGCDYDEVIYLRTDELESYVSNHFEDLSIFRCEYAPVDEWCA